MHALEIIIILLRGGTNEKETPYKYMATGKSKQELTTRVALSKAAVLLHHEILTLLADLKDRARDKNHDHHALVIA